MSDHRARYKNTGLDSKELRRRREEDSVQLRKQKRDDVLSKRRTLPPVEDDNDFLPNTSDLVNNHLNESNELLLDYDITKDIIDAILQDADTNAIIENAKKVRKILSKEPQPPFDQVIQGGLMPRLVQLLDRHDETTIQFEVAWILTNISSGTSEQTRAVVEHGAVPKLVGLMKSPDMKVCEQVVWALGNIVGDGAEYRDFVIKHDFVSSLLALIKPELDLGFLRNVTWVLVNLCRNKEPAPAFEVIQQIIPACNYLIQTSDLAILIDTAWAVSYITEIGPDYSQLVIDSQLLARMVPLLTHREIKIQTAAIRALGSIVTGNDVQTQAVIDAGALPHLSRLLTDTKDRIVKEALWFLSNVSAGSTHQIQAIIDNGLVPSIIHHLDKGDFSQQKEAAWTIYNMCLSGSNKQIELLVDENVIPPLCALLNITDTSVVRNVLESISCILSCCHETRPDVLIEIEACNGLCLIEELQQSPNPEIYEFAYNLIDNYFPTEEDGKP